jgi:hypothetical protein
VNLSKCIDSGRRAKRIPTANKKENWGDWPEGESDRKRGEEFTCCKIEATVSSEEGMKPRVVWKVELT